jgi:pimeloyl-ACP methyl ester carboxylesterase
MRAAGCPRHIVTLVLLLTLCVALGACVGPVGTTRADPKVVQAELARSATTTGDPSWATRNVLYEHGLVDLFDARPEDALAQIHKLMVATQGDPDVLFALAELSYIHGRSTGLREYSLAAAVYAYAFLFPEGSGVAPGRFDPRLRIAADLYNWSLAAAFASADGLEVVPRGGTMMLSFGKIEVAFDPASMRAGNRELYKFIPIAELEIYGLAMRYRWPGIGAPLAASTRLIESEKGKFDLVAPRMQVPLTALLRITQARRTLVEGQPLTSRLELHLAWDGEAVSIDGEKVPLENEPSAAQALTFTDIPVMEIELFGFLGRLSGVLKDRPPLVSTTPYRPGLIPVVFVHGTASSVVRWAEIYNRLLADPDLRSHYQFWFFQYDSGNPIALSALLLRDSLTTAVAKLDPEGKDSALRKMVLIGHSQGGLLVKMQVVDSGDQLWNAASKVPLDELRLSDTTRDLVQRALFLKPSPYVARVIFLCTPHRGSYVAGRNFIANAVRRLLTLPFALVGASAEIAQNPNLARAGITPVVPSAVDNMSPRHHFIKALQKIPVTPTVTVNSIIAVEGDGPVEQGNDGVVEYSSAHIEPVESELVVKWNHSLQGRPETIEEIRRILRLNIGLKTGGLGEAHDQGQSPPR